MVVNGGKRGCGASPRRAVHQEEAGMHLRRKVWEILDFTRKDDRASRIFATGMLALIFLNVIAVVAGSVKGVEARWGAFLHAFEVVSVVIFTIEYLGRLWACTADERFHGGVAGRVRFAFQGMSLVDLLSILPFYLPFVHADLRSLRALRLLRLFRIVKILRYYSRLNLIRRVFEAKKEELILTSILIVLLLVVSSSVLFYCENPVQPDVFSSIPATMWWAVTTFTTVGYGDIYPVTLLGKLFAGIVAILGIGMFALPTGILSAGFVEEVQRTKACSRVCPHCGREIK